MGNRLLRTYSELITLDDWESRFEYLRFTEQEVESPRLYNHQLYKTRQWRLFKEAMHTRDAGFDLGVFGVGIHGRMILHHINPVTKQDLENWNVDILLNPENVITTCQTTHNRIHYSLEVKEVSHTERQPDDTKLW